jgi:hypothetical protein
MPSGDMFPTERIAFRVDGVPIAEGQAWRDARAWRDALKAAAVEARRYAPSWIGVGPLACYIRLVTPRPRVVIDLAASAGYGVKSGSAYWNISRKPAWVFNAVLPSLGPQDNKAGILWHDIRQVCVPMADVRVGAVDDKPHSIIVVSELPPIECGITVNVVGLIVEADSWSVREEGLRAKGR